MTINIKDGSNVDIIDMNGNVIDSIVDSQTWNTDLATFTLTDADGSSWSWNPTTQTLSKNSP
jgi:hypothetical protein